MVTADTWSKMWSGLVESPFRVSRFQIFDVMHGNVIHTDVIDGNVIHVDVIDGNV